MLYEMQALERDLERTIYGTSKTELTEHCQQFGERAHIRPVPVNLRRGQIGHGRRIKGVYYRWRWAADIKRAAR